MLNDDLLHALHAKLFVMTALYFRDAVCVKNQAVAAFKLQLGLLVGPFGEETENASSYAQLLDGAVGVYQDRRVVAGIAVRERARFGVDHGEKERDEFADRHDLAQRFVQRTAKLLRINVVGNDALFQAAQTSRQQSARNALASNIGD